MKKNEADQLFDPNKMTKETSIFLQKRQLNDLIDSRVSYQDKEESNNYTVNHTANIYFLDKDNNVEKIFIPGTPFTEFYKYINRYMLKDIKNLPLQ